MNFTVLNCTTIGAIDVRCENCQWIGHVGQKKDDGHDDARIFSTLNKHICGRGW